MENMGKLKLLKGKNSEELCKIVLPPLFTFVVNNNALFCLSMQEKLPVSGPFNTKNAEYGDFEQKTIYSFITYAKIYKYLLTFLLLRSIL